jgi:hypothetical protein
MFGIEQEVADDLNVPGCSRSAPCDGHSVEIELVALDVLHHEARLVVVIGRQ